MILKALLLIKVKPRAKDVQVKTFNTGQNVLFWVKTAPKLKQNKGIRRNYITLTFKYRPKTCQIKN